MTQQRFYLIDTLRGIAALAVVFTHYHHFYLADFSARPDLPATETFPWAAYFSYLYDYGHLAVQLFWIISGFVFAHVYLDRRATLWQFAVARFARLYPLHFATLIIVAVLQLASVSWAGHWQIYENNDLRHFGLQLVFASNWATFSRGLSFNGPIWSVSWEIVAYALFFILLVPLRRLRLFAALGLAALFWWLALSSGLSVPVLNITVLSCAGYFFAGCAIYMLFIKLQKQPIALAAITVVLIISGVLIETEHLRITGISTGVILGLAMLEPKFAKGAHRLAPLGDMSYSLYLVHVPLQMCVLLAADVFWDGNRTFADSWVVLPIYVVVSVVIAFATYHWFERPVGRTIRQKLGG